MRLSSSQLPSRREGWGRENEKEKKEPKKAAPCSSLAWLSSRATGVDRAVPYLVVPGSHFLKKERERERKGDRDAKESSEIESGRTCSEAAGRTSDFHFSFSFPLLFFFFLSFSSMRSSVLLSSRRGAAPAACRGGASAPSRTRVAVASASAAPAQRRRLRRQSDLPTSTMKTKAVSGDETGLLTALSAAPPEAVAALGAGE